MNRQDARAALWGSVGFALLLGAAVYAPRLPTQGGLGTKAKDDGLCSATPRLLESLRSPISIDAYVTLGTPKMDAFAKDLDKLLQQYQKAAPDKVVVRLIDARDEQARLAAKEGGLMEMMLGEEEDDTDVEEPVIHKGFAGVVLKYRATQDSIKALAPEDTNGLEFWITSKIREMHAREDHAGYKIAVATGHGETPLRTPDLVPRQAGTSVNLEGIMNQNFPFYAFSNADLTKDGPEPGTVGLLLTQPTADFTDEELSRIDDYVMKGHSLVVAASAVNVKPSDPTMTFSLNAHGLPKLLASYGITMNEDLILDLHHSFSIKMPNQAGQLSSMKLSFLPITYASDKSPDASFLDKTAAIFFNMESLPVPFASSLTIDKSKQSAATFHVLAKTSAESARLSKGGALWPSMPSGEGVHSAAIVAASVEGVLTSAFGHGKSAKTARVLVLSSGSMFASPLARAANAPDQPGQGTMMVLPPTDDTLSQMAMPYAQQDLTQVILSFKNSLDWMAADEDFAKCAGKLIEKSDDQPKKKPKTGSPKRQNQ